MKRSKTAHGACTLLSHLLMWGSGGSFGAGHYAASVYAAFAAGVFYMLSVAFDPR